MKKKILFIICSLVNVYMNAKLFHEEKDYIEIDIQDLMNNNNNSHTSKVVVVTEANYEKEVTQSQQPVAILASTTWCQPCQIFKSIYVQVAEECSDMFKFVQIDLDNYKSFAIQHDIQSVPTILFSVNGKIVEKYSAFFSRNGFKTMLSTTYKKFKDIYIF